MLRIFHYTNKSGKEYIVLTEDCEIDPDEHCKPGYKFAREFQVEKKKGESFRILPLDTPLSQND